MRNFDNWNRYLDNNSKPLRGCVQFMVRDGNTSAPIYDADETPIDNPQLTDIYGRTQHQVFIEEDVTAYFYKYIGEGTIEEEQAIGIDTSDITKWSLQYTSENQMDLEIDIQSDTAMSIPDMSALRAVDPDKVPEVDGKKLIWLCGYNESGDCAAVMYYWDPESSANDDGGSVIQGSELTGRWIMIPPEVHLDVRHFGVFPYASQNNVENQRVGILNAVQYANQAGLRVWFPKTETNTGNNIEYKYYRYDNLYAVFGNGLDVDEGVVFLDNGTNSTFRFSDIHGDLHFQSAKTAVMANYAKASWNMRSLSKNNDLEPATYVIDTMGLSTGIRSLTKWKIECTTSLVYGFTFSDCELGEDGAFGSNEVDGVTYNNEFWYCKLTGKMFITSGEHEASLVNLAHLCEFDIQDFRHCPDLWRELRCTDDSNPFIDWQNLINPGKPYNSYVGNQINTPDVTVLNLQNLFSDRITIDKISDAHQNLILDNVTGWYRINAGLATTIKNSNIKLTLQNGNNIAIENSTVYLDEAGEYTVPPTVSFRNCTVIGEEGSVYKFENFSAYGSTLTLAMKNRFCVIKDSQINGELRLIPRYVEVGKTVTYEGSQVYVNHLISAYLDNNIFNEQLVIDGYAGYEEFGADHVLADNLVIENNRSNVTQSPWLVTCRGAMNSDALNSYSWKNNTGGFENVVTVEATCRLSTSDYHADGRPGIIAMTDHGNGHIVISAWAAATNVDEADYNKYFAVCRFFTIGTKDIVIDAEVLLRPRGEQSSTNNSQYLNYCIPSVIPVRWDDVRYSEAAHLESLSQRPK